MLEDMRIRMAITPARSVYTHNAHDAAALSLLVDQPPFLCTDSSTLLFVVPECAKAQFESCSVHTFQVAAERRFPDTVVKVYTDSEIPLLRQVKAITITPLLRRH